MKFLLLISIFAGSMPSTLASALLPLRTRQSTQWEYTCPSGLAPPSDFKAFNLGNCGAQLAMTKDRYTAVMWKFDAVYADGSRVTQTPFRDFNTFGVSDPLYPSLGNNFITRFPGSSAFTAVHEFTNVCRGGQAPVAWIFYTTAKTCSRSTFTSGRIPVFNGGATVTRPALVPDVSLRRVNDAGDFEASWSPAAGAAAYSVMVQYPIGTDDAGDPYLDVRGARVPKGRTNTTVATTTRRRDVARKVIVHAVDDKGLWSFTINVRAVEGSW
ncbi:uncharacterized protein L3040_005773 [Drepanopeziza brunnea f. sp. 'multigermtubi']|uniref:Uncharacterized protein n=1 Tax=Marssonina brunnea f. sp. multigermtubi (strain MB_m1) TaxID=1072389 RepID=K1XKC2_MARBU|nr:uncharacterized protein MBM_08868 [Drepanopeziza brunnea f. sp. 'multigermtubi' MB_m1]EKD12914.1 hypothetical protein MBM_08868 [Drepanopeziza brunnea f. sp. 'multigermtubi' MB_m1]KAJ5041225.1 hypothetical protein L3040_005773 [Drepanopeziza brunnea f. sp. 'multigermtubi']